jgi:CRP/FNR family transcriptional regulator, dissimilatory nitrate respiration regulator
MAHPAHASYDRDHMTRNTFAFAAGLPYRRKVLEASEALFLKGHRATNLFYVEQGSVRLMRTLEDGRAAVMHVARACEWIAESSVFSEVYHCDAFAEVQTKLLSVSKSSLLKQFRADPEKCMQFAEMLAGQLRALRGAHEMVRIRRADERLMRWLQLQASGEPPTLRIQGTWTQVADELAMTREALYRALSHLRKSGAVTVCADQVTLVPQSSAVRRKRRTA